MDNYSTRHTKGRPLPKTNYYPPTYGRTYRQNEYTFASSTRNSALLWHDGSKQMPKAAASYSKGKYCSIALAAATFFVLVAVLAIAGLALYMGALRTEPASPLITFSCRAKVIRGDRFIVGLADKARRYRMQLENLYQRSTLGPAFVSSVVDKFGNDTRTIFFRVTLNRKKIPRQIYNVEKSLKDILVGDSTSRKPIFSGIQFDSKSINIKRIDAELYQRPPPKSKEPPKRPAPSTMVTITKPPVPGVVKKTTDSKDIKPQESNGEGSVQGTFKISKTDADITEKNNTHSVTSMRPFVSSSVPKLKETYVTSALFKLASSSNGNNPDRGKSSITTTTSSTTSASTTTNTTTKATTPKPVGTTTSFLTTLVETTLRPSKPHHTTTKILNPFLSNGNVFNQEPWIPIYQGIETSTRSQYPSIQQKTEENINERGEPIYTSFTNQGLSWQGLDTERLGSTRLQGHPLPVNKISEVTAPIESIYFTTPYSLYPETETYEEVVQEIEDRQGEEELSEVESTTETTYIEVATLKYPTEAQNKSENVNDSSTVGMIGSTTSSTTLPPLLHLQMESSSNPVSSTTESSYFGQAEVIEADEISLMLQTTKLPLVTLLPVKSNSGVGRPIRPRPKRPNETGPQTENRSFAPNTKTNNEFLSGAKDHKGTEFIQTEVVTSVSQEHTRVKTHKQQLTNSFQIVSVLNFATEIPSSTLPEALLVETLSVTELPTESEALPAAPLPFQQILTPQQLAELSKISKVHTNSSGIGGHDVISTKAVSSGSHNGFNVLTKTYNKIPSDGKDKNLLNVGYNKLYFNSINASECSNFTIKCGDGQCLPNSTRCNNLVDCADGSDEKDCNCADYLRSQFLLKKICDGIVDCWDFSDENQCEWCLPNQYVCGDSKVCIERTSICDGITDCPHGDDERLCVTVAPNLHAAEAFPYNPEGFLMVRKAGAWGKLCVENFPNVVARSHMSWKVGDLGQAVCKAMTYKQLEFTNIIKENALNARYEDTPYYELTYSFNNATKSSLTFENTTCKSKEVVLVKCESLECGVRPQIGKKNASRMYRIVGGGNAGLGAWPWQAALYKEGEFQCGGTLISANWILSAGHCFYHSQKEHWVARMGNLRRGTALPSPYEQLRNIIKISLHPSYVDVGFINDISLLKMETPVIFSDYVRPICLPQAGIAPSDGRMCTVIGWGQLFEIGRIFPDTLQEVQVPIISTAECRKRTLFLPLYQVTDDMFCAGYDRGGRDACLGDSGGPLMCSENDGRWTLHGITSNGYGCARAFRPGVYTKVANYINWIQTFVQNNETDSEMHVESVGDKCNGHRCPLGECLAKNRICNGFIECSDGSDERGCLKT